MFTFCCCCCFVAYSSFIRKAYFLTRWSEINLFKYIVIQNWPDKPSMCKNNRIHSFRIIFDYAQFSVRYSNVYIIIFICSCWKCKYSVNTSFLSTPVFFFFKTQHTRIMDVKVWSSEGQIMMPFMQKQSLYLETLRPTNQQNHIINILLTHRKLKFMEMLGIQLPSAKKWRKSLNVSEFFHFPSVLEKNESKTFLFENC